MTRPKPEEASAALETARARIALVEDDEDLAFTLSFSLRRERYEVERYKSGLVALESLTLRPPDIILLDLNLPDVDGLTVCRELRKAEATRRVPIVMLTARAEERDKLLGFDLGADDYVTKPFSTKELLARIGANLRRGGGPPGSDDVYDDGRLVVDRARHQVTVEGKAVHLTKKEFDLLWLLIQSAGRVVTRETILSRLWDYASDVETRTVDVHIRSLRKKVGEDAIETVVGVGYRFPR
ncbi:MAG TPA: response regulator transcription factor [Thermoanaerobaculia bacterium]|jgi:DNA-binding response OmpR family regulator|nr:response regulator transcription factor [Thermoanaerobaculia bacterium]